ncbi:MAG: hypothetical protein ACREBW_08600, partial [Candidatus Micrarchaeaceae archaeon]
TQAAGMSSESAAMNNVVDALVHGVATGGVPVAVQQWLSERGINLSPNQTKVKDNAALAAVGRLLGARGFLNKSIIDVMSHLGPNLYKDPVNNIVSMAAFVSTELPALRAQLGAYDKNTVIRKPLEDAYQNLMSLQQRLKLLRYNPTTHRYIDIWGINNTIPASGALTPGGQEVTRQEVTQFLERSVKPITLDQAIQAASMYVDEKAAGVQSNNLRGPGAP